MRRVCPPSARRRRTGGACARWTLLSLRLASAAPPPISARPLSTRIPRERTHGSGGLHNFARLPCV
eukprot:6910715-Prymnesium_polylepis.1